MTRDVDPELFIRLLNDAVEADRVAIRAIRAVQNKRRAQRFMQLCRSDLNHAMASLEPMDCVQLIGAEK